MKTAVMEGDFLFVTRGDTARLNRLRHQKQVAQIGLVLTQADPQQRHQAMILVKEALKPYRHLVVSEHMPKRCITLPPLIPVRSHWQREWLSDLHPAVWRKAFASAVRLDELASLFVSEKRWLHVTSMTTLAVALANAHGISEKQAYVAGLFHDCTKNWSVADGQAWMRFCAPQALEEAPAVYHQYTGAAFLKRCLHVTDGDVLRAIRHHVKGDDLHPLSQILYIADKLDPSRGYDSSETIAVCMDDLSAGFARVQKQQEDYLRKTGVIG